MPESQKGRARSTVRFGRNCSLTPCTGPDTIIIVGHGAALKILRKVIFHYTYEWYEAEPNPANCSIMHLTLDNKARVNLDDGYVYVPAGEPV